MAKLSLSFSHVEKLNRDYNLQIMKREEERIQREVREEQEQQDILELLREISRK